MRNGGVLSAAAIALAACASVPAIPEPEFNVRVVQVPEALPGSASPFPTVVEVDVVNRSSETMMLQKIQISSFGQGRYTVVPTLQTFNRPIAPSRFDNFPVRVQVVAEETIGRAEEPIVIRGIVFFRIHDDSYRRTFTQRVDPSTLRRTGVR